METLTYTPKNVLAGYKRNEIMSATPVQLILRVFDYVIVNCKKHDAEKVNAGLTQLIASLNFDYRDISLGFFRIYRYCQNQTGKGNFDEVEKHITELRSAWAEAFKLA